MMNDRFKFRAWMGSLNQFVDGVTVYHDGSWDLTLDFDCGQNTITVDDSDVLMQCTGLKDKNGVLIFEGDIVLNEIGCKQVIKWLDNEACFCAEDIVFASEEDSQFNIMPTDEIIGNLFENPELIE